MARDMCFGAAPGSCAVLLTTYETFRTSCKDLSRVEFGALEPHERAESCLIQEAARETETETEDTKLDDEERIWRQRMATEISKNDALGSRPWDVVIMDEAHKIKVKQCVGKQALLQLFFASESKQQKCPNCSADIRALSYIDDGNTCCKFA